MAKLTKTLVFAMFTALGLCGVNIAGGLPDTGHTESCNDTASDLL